jgi:hypothetical protein
MNEKVLIYLDQNILQYDFEDKIKLSNDSEIAWVYSDEHFNEINRKEDSRFFDVLERIKARKIKVKLNDKFEITDECILLNYDDPKKLYDQYLECINEYKSASFLFYPLQVFFHGNTDSLDPKKYISDYKHTLIDLTKDIFNVLNNQDFQLQFNNQIDLVCENLEKTLISAKDQIKPLDKMRKLFTSNQFSNLDDKDGLIIDQIWNEISEKIMPLTKDQFFGKEVLPFLNPVSSNQKQLIFSGIVQCHSALNFLGYWPDEGLPKMSKIFGITSDASHIAHSYFCSGIISADNRLCQKAKAIYEYFGKAKTVFQLKFEDQK